MPVSYTHLDVYKRQLPAYAKLTIAFKLILVLKKLLIVCSMNIFINEIGCVFIKRTCSSGFVLPPRGSPKDSGLDALGSKKEEITRKKDTINVI